MASKFGVKLRKYERIAPIPELGEHIEFSAGDLVIVDTNRGFECGKIVFLCPGAAHKYPFEVTVNKIKRIATNEDLLKLDELIVREEELVRMFNAKCEHHKLPVKLVGVDLLFDGIKVFFYYRVIEDGKRTKPVINIRPLIQDLANELKLKIDVREAGVRGEAKIIGGLGECGKTLCCASWLHRSKPITVKMAKEQGLAINIPKLSGVCSRLKCCLQYEKECYHDGKLVCHHAEAPATPQDQVTDELEQAFKKEGHPTPPSPNGWAPR